MLTQSYGQIWHTTRAQAANFIAKSRGAENIYPGVHGPCTECSMMENTRYGTSRSMILKVGIWKRPKSYSIREQTDYMI